MHDSKHMQSRKIRRAYTYHPIHTRRGHETHTLLFAFLVHTLDSPTGIVQGDYCCVNCCWIRSCLRKLAIERRLRRWKSGSLDVCIYSSSRLILYQVLLYYCDTRSMFDPSLNDTAVVAVSCLDCCDCHKTSQQFGAQTSRQGPGFL